MHARVAECLRVCVCVCVMCDVCDIPGSVTSVKVTVFNSTAVNVSWTPLPSLDITSYTVYYSRVAE